MALKVITDRCTGCGRCITVCPFDAVYLENDVAVITPGCRVCRLCIKECPEDALYLEESSQPEADMADHSGVLVVAEAVESKLHPVTLELMGKGRELADELQQKLYVVVIGHGLKSAAEELLQYGADEVWLYEDASLKHFRIEPHTNAAAHAVSGLTPNIVLIGATPVGRSLAPRLAVRLRTGLTADCTTLKVKENGDLVQIRPAFGGDVMAQIVTPQHRPQMATVRHKVMDPAQRFRREGAVLRQQELTDSALASRIRVHSVHRRREKPSISDAEIVVAVGRGVKEQKDLKLADDLARLLGGQVGVTRPLVEMGWGDHTQQIGLSGRSIRPKLLIALGISGAVQFTAGASGAECVVAINSDPDAPVFSSAHYGLVGDLYEIVPKVIAGLERGESIHAVL